MEADDTAPKTHYYILDPSALVYGGIGKIKKWVETTVENYRNGTDKTTKIVFYVSSYTLKELDFLKKVFNPLISATARESIKFIDNQISDIHFDDDDDFNETGSDHSCYDSDLDAAISDNDSGNEENDNFEDDSDSGGSVDDILLGFGPTAGKKKPVEKSRADSNDYTDFESYNKLKLIKKSNFKRPMGSFRPVTFILESEQSVGPDWKIASGYRRSTPLLSDLPKPINGYSSKGQIVNDDNRKYAVGVFGNNIPGTFNMSKNNDDSFNGSNNCYNSNFSNSNYNNSYNNFNGNNNGSDDKAVVPLRLKFLIRSCIQKQYIENRNKKDEEKINWEIICEDSTTSIWLKSFGLSVKSLNEIQPKFDQNKGEEQAKVLYDPISGQLVETASTPAATKSNKITSKSRRRGGRNNERRARGKDAESKKEKKTVKVKKLDVEEKTDKKVKEKKIVKKKEKKTGDSDKKVNTDIEEKTVEQAEIEHVKETVVEEKKETEGEKSEAKGKKVVKEKKEKKVKKEKKDKKADEIKEDESSESKPSKPKKKKNSKSKESKSEKPVALENIVEKKEDKPIRIITAESFAERRTGELWMP